MNKPNEAFDTLVLKVLVPFNDVRKIIELSKEPSPGFTILNVEPVNEQLSMIEFMLETAFSLYSLGKLVAYNEFLNPTKANQHDA